LLIKKLIILKKNQTQWVIENMMHTKKKQKKGKILAFTLGTVLISHSLFIYAESEKDFPDPLTPDMVTIKANDISPCLYQGDNSNANQDLLFDRANGIIYYQEGQKTPEGYTVSLDASTQYLESVVDHSCADYDAYENRLEVIGTKNVVMANGQSIKTSDYVNNRLPEIVLGASGDGNNSYKTTFARNENLSLVAKIVATKPQPLDNNAQNLLADAKVNLYYVAILDGNVIYQFTENGVQQVADLTNLSPYKTAISVYDTDDNIWNMTQNFSLTGIAENYSQINIYAGFKYPAGQVPGNPALEEVIYFNSNPLTIDLVSPDSSRAKTVETHYYSSRKDRIWYTETLVDKVRHGKLIAYNYHGITAAGYTNAQNIAYEIDYDYGLPISKKVYFSDRSYDLYTYANGVPIKMNRYDNQDRMISDIPLNYQYSDITYGGDLKSITTGTAQIEYLDNKMSAYYYYTDIDYTKPLTFYHYPSDDQVGPTIEVVTLDSNGKAIEYDVTIPDSYYANKEIFRDKDYMDDGSLRSVCDAVYLPAPLEDKSVCVNNHTVIFYSDIYGLMSYDEIIDTPSIDALILANFKHRNVHNYDYDYEYVDFWKYILTVDSNHQEQLNEFPDYVLNDPNFVVPF